MKYYAFFIMRYTNTIQAVLKKLIYLMKYVHYKSWDKDVKILKYKLIQYIFNKINSK